MKEVITRVLIYILFTYSFNVYADAASATRSLSKQQVLQYLPEDVNQSIRQNGGKIYIEPGTYLINVKSIHDNIEYTYQHPINELASMISSLQGISISDAKKLIKTKKFKNDWINKTIKNKFMVSNCTTPLYMEILNKGITIVYHYQYDSGEKVGSLSINKSMCK